MGQWLQNEFTFGSYRELGDFGREDSAVWTHLDLLENGCSDFFEMASMVVSGQPNGSKKISQHVILESKGDIPTFVALGAHLSLFNNLLGNSWGPGHKKAKN